MRLTRQRDGGLTLHLTAKERPLLETVLDRFPVVPVNFSRLTRDASGPDKQSLLEAETLRRESWTEQVRETCERLGHVRKRLTWPPPDKCATLRLKTDEVEMLLQVLNDVRVGSWIQLGCPDPLPEPFTGEGEETELPRRLLDLAGLFESLLLQALELPEEGTAEP